MNRLELLSAVSLCDAAFLSNRKGLVTFGNAGIEMYIQGRGVFELLWTIELSMMLSFFDRFSMWGNMLCIGIKSNSKDPPPPLT